MGTFEIARVSWALKVAVDSVATGAVLPFVAPKPCTIVVATRYHQGCEQREAEDYTASGRSLRISWPGRQRCDFSGSC